LKADTFPCLRQAGVRKKDNSLKIIFVRTVSFYSFLPRAILLRRLPCATNTRLRRAGFAHSGLNPRHLHVFPDIRLWAAFFFAEGLLRFFRENKVKKI